MPCVLPWPDKFPIFPTGAGCVTLLATFGSHYKDDDHWKDLDPCLGWCFWLMLAVAAGTCALGFISVYYAQKDQWKPLPKVAPLQQRSWRRASNASQISISKSKKIIIFRTEEYNSANMVLPQTTHQPADWDAQETISLKFPILDLPQISYIDKHNLLYFVSLHRYSHNIPVYLMFTLWDYTGGHTTLGMSTTDWDLDLHQLMVSANQ